MNHVSNWILCGLLLASSTVLLSTSVSAEDGGPPTAPVEGASSGGLEEIVVTARKRTENLQNIPVAETVISGAALEQQGIDSIGQVSAATPGLIIGSMAAGNGSSISLRGINVDTTSISLEQSVATVIDGVYYDGGRALNEGLFDLQRVEVLKGPQSLFYGKNTTAGAISVTTADPTPDFEGMVSAGYEIAGEEPQIQAIVSGPITDTLSFRIAGEWSKQYGAYFHNLAYGQTVDVTDQATGKTTAYNIPASPSDDPAAEEGLIRVGLKWEPIDRFSATVKASYNSYDTNGPNSNIVRIDCPLGVAQPDPAAPCGQTRNVVEEGVSPAELSGMASVFGKRNGQPYQNYESVNVAGNLEYHADKYDVSVIPAYVWWRNQFLGDYDSANNYPARNLQGSNTAENSSNSATSVEARVQTHFNDPFNFMGGVYYLHSDLNFFQVVDFPGVGNNSAAADPRYNFAAVVKDSYTDDDTYATFGQVLIDITKTLNFAVGARYTSEHKNNFFSQPYVTPELGAAFAEAAITTPQTFHNFSPEATLTFKPLDNITVYGSFKTGFKSGGYSISGLLPANEQLQATFEPEKVKGFEAGIKTTWNDNHLRFNMDVFDYIYSNLQLDFLNAQTISYITVNAGDARTTGGEFDVEYAPPFLSGIRFEAQAAYTNARYTSFSYAPCLTGQTIAGGCNIGATPIGTFANQNLTGQPTADAPRWTGSIAMHYDRSIGGQLNIGATASERYSSPYRTYPFANGGSPRYVQGSYGEMDASIRLYTDDDKWEFAVIGRNLTDAYYVNTAFDAPFTGSGSGTAAGVPADVLGSVADPRLVVLKMTRRFK
jgi:iron complex outermembrane receptor protein